MPPASAFAPSLAAGSVALDGEREPVFDAHQSLAITLIDHAFPTIDVAAVMRFASMRACCAAAAGSSSLATITAEGGNTSCLRTRSCLAKVDLLNAYRTMRTIREFEERLHVEFAKGDIPGFVHLYAGEEACAAGIMMHLTDIDRIASTHRGHGHCIGKGVDVREMMAEIHGRATGACRGKGGSMHIADLSKGMMGANGILGAGAPLICGAGLAAKFRGDGGVGVTFGDGASNQGTVLESMNSPPCGTCR